MSEPVVTCCAVAKVHLTYDAKLRAFVIFHDRGYVEVWFCPWCGAKLPGTEQAQEGSNAS